MTSKPGWKFGTRGRRGALSPELTGKAKLTRSAEARASRSFNSAAVHATGRSSRKLPRESCAA
eukprot:1139407-Alexandrium_andersonii.AAC.1